MSIKLNTSDIDNLERKFRLNLINSLSGIKPANLLGTRSKNGVDNLAVFSSVVHLGSNPAQFGFILRPQTKNPRDTFKNILETYFYTINHISSSFIKNAHYTSAKLKPNESEFDRMKIDKEFIDDFYAPFVKESKVKIGLKFLESIPLPNGCSMVIGNVVKVIYPKKSINELGQLNLEEYSCAGISGLNTYYKVEKIETFPYVRENNIPDF